MPMKCLANFLVAAGVAAAAVAEDAKPAAQRRFAQPPRPAEALYQELLRPHFHFTARYWDGYTVQPDNDGREGWINDVNGPIWLDGEYHLFGQRWWHAWVHAVSRDLVHWTELKPAFGEGGRFAGTQSGTCVVDYQNVSGLSLSHPRNRRTLGQEARYVADDAASGRKSLRHANGQVLRY
jgi:sucrose-6-phosphate hydrolase SacC (GH32 family)